MKFLSDMEIELDRELSDLDIFALDFIRILRKYARYAVVSGYVAILLGRSRSSEDVDVIIEKMDFGKFSGLLAELKEKWFYCLNAENEREIFDYLKDKFGIRFARLNTAIPNMEVKFAKNRIDEVSLDKTIRVKLREDDILISNLELNIAFKEKILKSKKDLEDARHLRNISKGHLNLTAIKMYEKMLDEIYS